MINIKQKFLKFITSFICLISISACEQIKNFSTQNIMRETIVDIAILLPLSGPKQELSKEYIKMIKMGLSDGAETKIRVSSYDSSNKEKLNESLEKIFEVGTDIIIGPIHSAAAKIVANKVKGRGTIVLSLSNEPILADRQVFVLGHAPMKQMEQLINYFLEKNYKNYIALLPSGKRSILISKILQDMINNDDGNLAKIEFYGNSPQDIAKSVALVSNSVDKLNENDFNLTKPVIILADDSATLQLLYNSFHIYGLDKKSIIAGDNRTDIDSITPLDINFTGSLNIIDTDIKMRAKKAGINHISSIHSMSYDAGKMISNNIGTRFNKKEFLSKMNSLTEFVGLSGNIHFIDSIAQRRYDIIKKLSGEYKAITESEN